MKKSLSAYLQRIVLSVAFLFFSLGAYANHIIGMELEYVWNSGSTYTVNLVVYGDCGDVTGAYPLLPTSTPAVAVFNGGTYVTCLTLAVDSPSAGIFTSPVCPADTDLTTCTSLSYTIPGIHKFVYSTTYTFSGTSHYWRFAFLGSMGAASFAGRQATITNILAPGTSVICLIDTLDNTYHNNVSSTLGNTPTPFYCLNQPNNYDPNASNADGDSIVYSLVPGEVGNYPVMICNTIPGTFVDYTGTAWGAQPITDTTPLEVTAGTYSFSHVTGDITFTPNYTQRALVVYNIDEYRNDTFIGNSQHELVFVVETCTTPGPSASVTAATGAGLATDSVNYTICEGTGAFSFHLDPTSTGAGLTIAVIPASIPTGASFTVAGDSTTAPTCTFSWTSTGVPLGTYTFFVTYTDDNCPINGSQTIVYTVTITAPPVIAATAPDCVGSTITLSPTPTGGIWSSGSTAIATVGSASGIVGGVSPGTSVISYSLGSGCNVTTVVTANPVPGAISGATIVCPGSTITLGDAATGGTWVSGTTTIATVSGASGSAVVTGVSPGTTTITYTVGGCSATKIVTVTALPPAIGGTPSGCQYTIIPLSDAGGGTWTSSNTAVATVGSTGNVTGTGPGTATITYSIGTGCSVTDVVTVNPAPSPIGGTAAICGGTTLLLTDVTTGGTWMSSSTTIASIGLTSGLVTAGGSTSSGVAIITYTAPGGCFITTPVTVNPAASAIGGTPTVCAGQTTDLYESGSGTWSSSSTLIATVGTAATATAVVTGVATSGGTATITFTLPTGCSTSTLFTVTGLTTPIMPPNPFVCIGGTVGLSDATAGGFWTSNNPVIAIVDPIFGTVTGEAAGVDTIEYVEGCNAYIAVTVNPSPPIITGDNLVCPDSTIVLSDAEAGGTWSSSSTSIATIGSSSGVVGGVSPVGGFVTITYTAPTGCSITSSISVYSATPTFPSAHVCVGGSVGLTDPIVGGAWSSANTAIASITSPGGVVTGGGAGTDIITYTLSTGCAVTGVVTVNAAPGPIGGTRSVCVGSTTDLTDVGGGTWTSSSTAIATIGSATGIVTGVGTGTAATTITTITYSTGGTCVATATVTVDALPTSVTVTGSGSYCAGAAGVAIGVTGSTVGARDYLYFGGAAIDSLPGTGGILSFGDYTAAGIYTVVATNLATGCSRTMTTNATVAIIAAPAPFTVTGGGTYCSGSTTYPPIGLSGSTVGVVYKLYNGATLVTTVNGTSAALTFGTFPGSGTYTVIATTAPPTSCSATMTGSAVVTIAGLPGLETVSGGGAICPGGAGKDVTLSGSVADVEYILELGGIATSDSLAGTGAALDFGLQSAAGTYTVLARNAAGCTRTMTGSAIVTVSPAPVIGGPTAVCEGASVLLTETTAGVTGGTWSSSNTAVATIVTATGTLWGETTLGTSTITYTSPGGCTATEVVSVSPAPGAIAGLNSVCVGATTTESDPPTGGSWTCSPTTIATVSGGVVTGVSAGPVTITYSLGSGCTVTKPMTVTSAPDPIGGVGIVCDGSSAPLSEGTGGGTWSSSNSGVATVGSTGTVYSVGTGISTITYTLGGCTATGTETVAPAPGPIGGPGSVCVGATILLTDGTGGGTWTSSASLIASVDGGTIYGLYQGTATITYSTGGACVSTKVITVDPISAITGSTGLCVSTTTTLTDMATGGAWLSSNTSNATISGTGTVTGVASGTSMITYTTPAGCTAITEVTVNTIPSLITGILHVCVGNCTPLYDSAGGGTWTSSDITVASVNSASGLVCGGIIAGTSTITYSLGYGCTKSVVVTVNGLPSLIGGTLHACQGGSTTLTETGTGTWSVSPATVATLSGPTSGTVWGAAPGTATIVFTPPTGCPATTIVTINPIPSGILGTLTICEGSSASLSNATSGGTWSSSNTAVATITTATGIVYGLTEGFSTITYSAGGCTATALLTVLAPPPAITGGPAVCAGQSVALHDVSTGGTWSTGPSSLATIDATTGVFWGVSSGTVLVFYTTGTGCMVSTSIIVNAVSPVSGDSIVCQGQSVTLTDTTEGGSWISGNTAVATTYLTGLTTGLVTGASGGTATITYLLPTGCQATETVTVNPGPPVISGPRTICYGSTVTLGDAITGGVWSSSSTVVSIISSSAGVVEGAYASGGTATITYSLAGTGCPALTEVTVYPVPPAISGESMVCVGTTLSLTDGLPGGAWGSTDTLVATVNAMGLVSGILPGTTTISYLFGTCSTSMIVTVSAPPVGITGPLFTVCSGSAITLHDATPGGSWSSGDVSIATVDASGDVTGADTGGTVIISYTTGTGCTANVVVTVNPVPNVIGEGLCQGIMTTLTDLPGGGTWSSNDTSVLSVDTLTGAATAVSVGTATLTYTSSAGCSITGGYTVNPSTGALTGSTAICLGFSTTLNDTTLGGSWTSSNTAVATVDGSGDVYGIAPGTSTIIYGSGSCPATIVVTVNEAPGGIEGITTVCTGSTTTLGDSPAGGSWSSSDATIATVDLYSGVVTGTNTTGTSQTVYINYSVGVGCTTYTTVTVNPVPSGIYGTTSLCDIPGTSGALFDGTVGGTWSSGDALVAFSSPSEGVYTVTGAGAGTSTVSYTLGTGCAATTVVTVNTQPLSISGMTQICLLSAVTLSDEPGGGAWSSNNTGIASVANPAIGIITGKAVGVATITYMLGDGCLSSTTVSVDSIPTVFTVTGTGSYCAGGAGVPIGLDGSRDGVNYFLYLGSTATGTVSGTGGAISFGDQREAGTYTVIGTSTASGCSNNMAGSATVTIIPNVAPSVSLSTGIGDTVCAGTSTTFTPAPTNGGLTPTYQWYVNGTAVSASGTYTYVPANGDEVSVTLTSDAHCVLPATASATLRMTVWDPQLPVASIAISPGDTVCQGAAVSLSAEPLYGGLLPIYTWVKNGITATSGPAYIYVPANGDSVYVNMTSDYPCRLATTVQSNVVVIGVDTPELPMVTINASPGTSVAIGQFDTLTASVVNGGTNPHYQWVVDEIPVAGATNNTYISNNFQYPNEDSVSCLVTSSSVCNTTSYGWVYISLHPEGVTTQTAGGEISILPNPNKGSFTIKGTLNSTADQEVSIELTDMLGQSVYKETIQAPGGRLNEQINLSSSIANGMYLLNLRSGDNSQVFHMVIEQ